MSLHVPLVWSLKPSTKFQECSGVPFRSVSSRLAMAPNDMHPSQAQKFCFLHRCMSLKLLGTTNLEINWVVFSNIFSFHPDPW